MASKKTASVETVSSVRAGVDIKAKVVKLPKTTETPTTLGMVMEALRKNIDRKGASVPAIRAYILTNYPSVDPVRLRMLLRRALIRGMEKGLLIRPNNSTATGATGRFKLAPANKKIVKKVSENTDPNEATGPKAKKLPAKKTKPSTTKAKATGDADGKPTVKRAATKGETAAPKAKKATAKAPKAAAKKPKEKGETASTKSKKPAGATAKAEPARVSAKEAKTNGKKAAASTVQDSSSADKDSAKPAANKRGKK